MIDHTHTVDNDTSTPMRGAANSTFCQSYTAEEDFRVDSKGPLREEAHPVYDANPTKLACVLHVCRPNGWPIAASAFNRLRQYASSPGNMAYCYAELTVSSLAMASTH